jgi:putative salt-induced outer membrane protein
MRRNVMLSVVIGLLGSILAQAQAPAGPQSIYTGSLGGGFALTGGNTNTRNYNLSFALTRDPKKKNVIKASALYLRGLQDDILNLDRASLNLRDEYTFSTRTFLFAQGDYLRDRFKDIIYLLSPSAGIGYKLVNNERTQFSLSGGAGGVWERNPGVPVRKSGTVNVGQSFSHKLSPDATLTQTVSTFAKMHDFEDTLTTFAVGLTTSINRRFEMKFEFLDNYKSRPPTPLIRKNDSAFVASFMLKY